ncbi:MAG: 1-acyl-sn-glycerol-3-phosphate acyltransferase, partial [Clostridia bacterium]|nr:1-acyl-sn-glycerol-3-phosphate acyltransferase [Clostridia bacterium]
KEKRVVGIFPEGHINNNTSKVDFFKSGIILMAMQGEVPIVPVAILKREKWWHRQIVVVGETIEITKDKLNLTQIDDLSASLRKKEEELINIYLNKRRNK